MSDLGWRFDHSQLLDEAGSVLKAGVRERRLYTLEAGGTNRRKPPKGLTEARVVVIDVALHAHRHVGLEHAVVAGQLEPFERRRHRPEPCHVSRNPPRPPSDGPLGRPGGAQRGAAGQRPNPDPRTRAEVRQGHLAGAAAARVWGRRDRLPARAARRGRPVVRPVPARVVCHASERRHRTPSARWSWKHPDSCPGEWRGLGDFGEWRRPSRPPPPPSRITRT